MTIAKYDITAGVTRPGGVREQRDTMIAQVYSPDITAELLIARMAGSTGLRATPRILSPCETEYRAQAPDGTIYWVSFDDLSVYTYS